MEWNKNYKWNGQADSTCVFCQDPLETRAHLFFHCHYANQIWERIAKGFMGEQYTSNWDQLTSLIAGTSLEPHPLFLLRYALQTTIHTIWRERNNRRHGENSSTVHQLEKTIDKIIRNRITLLGNSEIKNMRISSVFGSPLEANLCHVENFFLFFLNCCTWCIKRFFWWI